MKMMLIFISIAVLSCRDISNCDKSIENKKQIFFNNQKLFDSLINRITQIDTSNNLFGQAFRKYYDEKIVDDIVLANLAKKLEISYVLKEQENKKVYYIIDGGFLDCGYNSPKINFICSLFFEIDSINTTRIKRTQLSNKPFWYIEIIEN